MRFRSLSLAALVALATTPAHAGIPVPWMSYIAPHLVSCPAGDSAFVVVPRHDNGAPWLEGPVSLHICSCEGLHLSQTGSRPYTVDSTGCIVSASASDLSGTVLFPLTAGGLCPGDSIGVDAGGVWLGYVTRVASLDQNGDLRMDDTDLAIVESKVGTADPTADFDGDGVVTTADVSIVQRHLGHHAPGVLDVPVATLRGLSLSVQPNPFSNETRFDLTLPSKAMVDVSLYAVDGRHVSTVYRGSLGAGSHEFGWSGRRSDGLTPSGVYFVRASSGGRVIVRRAVYLSGR